MEIRHFENGQKVGAYYAWWPNGTLKLAYHFANGEYNGRCSEWNDQKMLVKEMHYKDGYESGSQKEFYNDGKIKANYIMTDGRRYGLLGTKNCVNVSDSIFKK
jgi:antitoxin component YwqK of YwqJK toxin-antitoxin module